MMGQSWILMEIDCEDRKCVDLLEQNSEKLQLESSSRSFATPILEKKTFNRFWM
jgi:hypothetical protein